MPTSHRIACFRDDLIFFIFLYQLYLYPIDKKRANEYGLAYDEGHKELPPSGVFVVEGWGVDC